MPSLRAAPRPRTRIVRPLAVPAGSFRVTGAPPRVGTLISAPRAASGKVTGTRHREVFAAPAEDRVRPHVHGDEQVAGRAAALPRGSLALEPDLLTVRHTRGDAGVRSCWLPVARPLPWQVGARVLDDHARAVALRGRARHREAAQVAADVPSCPEQDGQIFGVVPALAPVPSQARQAASLVSRSGTVVAVDAPRRRRCVTSASTSAPRRGAAAPLPG